MKTKKNKAGKWERIPLILICLFLLGAGCLALLNVAVDPFGVLGDPVMHWQAYDMTQNPQTAKFEYLKKHRGEYDAFLIGGPEAGVYSVQGLNRYTGLHFYNFSMSRGDGRALETMADYLADQENTKEIVLCLDPGEIWGKQDDGEEGENGKDGLEANLHSCLPNTMGGLSSVMQKGRYLFLNPKYSLKKISDWKKKSAFPSNFDCFVPETGCVDSRMWDVDHIGDLKSYQLTDPQLWKAPRTALDPEKPKELARQVARIKDRCLEKGIRLSVLISPVYGKRAVDWEEDVLKAGFRELAHVTDFWDFSGFTDSSGVGLDSRYFYDFAHVRKSAADMALARVFGDSSRYVCPGFGVPVTSDGVDALLKTAGFQETEAKQSSLAQNSVPVPILMFHDLGEKGESGVAESLEHFQNQMQALSDAGYHTLFFSDLENYVDQGTPLPDKPLLITFDDGYLSNYTMAGKALQQFGMKATVFSIGNRVGITTHNQYGRALSSYFDYDQARQMWQSGVWDIQSHSFDMHQEPYFDGKQCRKGVLPLPGETEADYKKAFQEDIEKSVNELEQQVGNQVTAFAYPYGYFTPFSEALLREEGIRATVSINPGVDSIVKGLPESLQSLCRINVDGKISGGELVDYLDQLTADH